MTTMTISRNRIQDAHDARRISTTSRQAGKLKRVAKTVDVDVGAGRAREVDVPGTAGERSASVCTSTHVAGSEMPLVLGALGSSTEAYAIGLGIARRIEINAHHAQRACCT